jgi:hypothetical protein
MKVMISLVGEQPAPNVLPLHHFLPDKVVLVHTKRTAALAGRIALVIRDTFPVQEPFCETDPYLVESIRNCLEEYLRLHSLENADLIFNLTGGTKTMEYAALELARLRNARAFYYQTEDNQSLIHPYRFASNEFVVEPPFEISQALTLVDYLSLYVGKVEPNHKPPEPFEKLVYATLKQVEALPYFEVMSARRLVGVNSTVEVDALVRLGNQVAVLEVKQKADKSAIDQLNSATRLLGTYVRKILVSATALKGNNPELAQAYNIHAVVLPNGSGGDLTTEDEENLISKVKFALEPRR